jgi:hypothetical protein
MAARGWLIGCGTLAVVAALIIVAGVAFVATRAKEVVNDVETARTRYADVNRDFPFQLPPAGEMNADRFARYLKVRAVLDAKVAPLKDSRGVVQSLYILTNMPDQVSQAHVAALRENSMSLEEYRWISRQLYTTVAAEQQRSDADPAVKDLRRILNGGGGRRGGIQIRTNDSRSSEDTFDPNLLDYTWLRVPEATRALVREHAGEIAKMPNASLAENLLLNVSFEGQGGRRTNR